MKKWMTTTVFDPVKFKQRYGLKDSDFEFNQLNGEYWVRLADNVTLPNNPPIFDPPSAAPESGLAVIDKPVRLAAGSARQDRAAVTLTPGSLLTHPQLGALEFTDDGVNGSVYITLHIKGVLTRMRLI